MSFAWSHSPRHFEASCGVAIVTAGTYCKQHFFRTSNLLEFLMRTLLNQASECGWDLDAWTVFSNHYHFIGSARAGAMPLATMIRRIHSISAREVNKVNNIQGQRVWFQYWESTLTYEASYLARLKYVHENPVRHGIVATAEAYPFCSARLFAEQAPAELQNRVVAFKCDRVNVLDPFDAIWIE